MPLIPRRLGRDTLERDVNRLKSFTADLGGFAITDPLYVYNVYPVATETYDLGSATLYFDAMWSLNYHVGDDPADYQGSMYGTGSLTHPQVLIDSTGPSASAAGNYSELILTAISITYAEDVDIVLAGGDENASDTPYLRLGVAGQYVWIDQNGRLAVNYDVTAGTNATGLIHANQDAAAGAIPVLHLEQDDVSEEFARFTGTAAAGVLTQSIVDEGDQASETREGWLKVYVVDEGNQITDQAYFVPLYTLSA